MKILFTLILIFLIFIFGFTLFVVLPHSREVSKEEYLGPECLSFTESLLQEINLCERKVQNLENMR